MPDQPKPNGSPSPDLTNGAFKGAMPEGHAPDPTTHRIVHTRKGTVAIPRQREGVPLSEYLQNADLALPADLARARVHDTPKGPVLVRADPHGWTPEQGEKAKAHAAELKAMIEEKGYYSGTLKRHAAQMAEQTGLSRDEMKAVITRAFEDQNGRDPFTYLQERRAEKGLPVKEREPEQKSAPRHEQGR